MKHLLMKKTRYNQLKDKFGKPISAYDLSKTSIKPKQFIMSRGQLVINPDYLDYLEDKDIL